MACLLGFDTKPYHHYDGKNNDATMLNVNFLPQLAILVLVTLQQLNYSAILAASRRSKSFSSTTSSGNYVPAEIRSFFAKASQFAGFVIPMMILVMSLVSSLAPPLNVVGALYLLIYFFVRSSSLFDRGQHTHTHKRSIEDNTHKRSIEDNTHKRHRFSTSDIHLHARER